MLVYLNQALEQQLNIAKRQQVVFSTELLNEAIAQGAGKRIRPIMMTGASIVIGLLPILFSTGTGSEVMSRIAAPMVGGMVTAMGLSLVVLPAIYSLWQRYRLIR